MTHTRVLYWTKGVGERKKHHDYVFKNVTLESVSEADAYLEWGHEGNFLISDALELSKYGALENWAVTEVMLLNDEDLADLNEIRKLEKQVKSLNKQAEKTRKETQRLQKELDNVKELNRKELERLGWSSLTDEEVEWFMTTGKKHSYFLPSAQQIKSDFLKAQKDANPSVVDKFEGFEELRHTNGWLDPYGKYYPVKGFAEHNNWAGNWLEEHGQDDVLDGYKSAYEVLEKLGWLRVMDWGTTTGVRFGHTKKPTHEQKETLYLFCSLHGINNPFNND